MEKENFVCVTLYQFAMVALKIMTSHKPYKAEIYCYSSKSWNSRMNISSGQVSSKAAGKTCFLPHLSF